MGEGLSVGMFASDISAEAIREFTAATHIVYSNKQSHKVYRIVGEPDITVEAKEGWLGRRYSVPVRGGEIDVQREKPDFHLNFRVTPETGLRLDPRKINRIPVGLTGYDMHVAELLQLRI